jgi:hypothetical protein
MHVRQIYNDICSFDELISFYFLWMNFIYLDLDPSFTHLPVKVGKRPQKKVRHGTYIYIHIYICIYIYNYVYRYRYRY